MRSHEIQYSGYWAWVCGGLMGPLALYSAGCSWWAVLPVALASGLVCKAVLSRGRGEMPKALALAAALWTLLVLGWVLGESSRIWPRAQSYPAVPLVLLGLGLWSAGDRAKGPRLGAVCFRLLLLLLGFVLVCALGDVQWQWTRTDTVGNLFPVATLALVPAAGVFYPRSDSKSGWWWLLPGLIAGAAAFCAAGVLSASVAATLPEPLWELGRSIRVLGRTAKLESLLCAGLIVSWFCLVNLLLTVSLEMLASVLPGKEKYCLWAAAVLLCIWVLWGKRLAVEVLWLGSTICWGFLPFLARGIEFAKKIKKSKKSA